MAEERQDRREGVLGGGGSRQFSEGAETGSIRTVVVRKMRDPQTGRVWSRVFVADVDSYEELLDLEAQIEREFASFLSGGQ